VSGGSKPDPPYSSCSASKPDLLSSSCSIGAVQALRFHVAVFLGAFLLFLVQPLMAKQILPWFGGGSVVWASCLLFFQIALVGGYAYAHLSRRLGVKRQIRLHLLLLALALLTLPIVASAHWKPVDGSAPVGRVAAVLALTVGFPYVLLAATAPMLQDWFARRFPDRSPYRLYVLSNVGSLLALGLYPPVLERYMELRPQAVLWSVGFVVFGAVALWCSAAMRDAPDAATLVTSADPAPGLVDRTLWFLLPAIGSGLLVATTSTLTQDVAAVPLLWVVPLALYLVTFIAAFGGLYWRWVWGSALVILLATTIHLTSSESDSTIILQGVALVGAFTAAAMVCHGELAQLKPAPSRLTSFYLAIAIGGSLGAAFVTLVAPLLFNWYGELPLLFLLALAALFGVGCRTIAREYPGIITAVVVVACVAALAVTGYYGLRPPQRQGLVASARGFYGILRVFDEGTPSRMQRKLWHGRIVHGVQFLVPPELGRKAGSYYAPGSGIETAISQHPRRDSSQPLKIGVVGLGSGTVAALGQPLDHVRFFELDPLVVEVSNRYFTYLKNSPARTDIVTGDARLSLEREMVAEQHHHSYDVLAIDAFSGDAIPVHLLTREAFRIYEQALRPDGILAVHISNRYLNLRPVVRAGSTQLGWPMLEIDQASGGPDDAIGNTWLLVTRNETFLDRARPAAVMDVDDGTVAWTDAFSSLLTIWKN